MQLDVESRAGDVAALERSNMLLGSITRALELYFRDVQPADLFRNLLADLLALTQSEYGYIAEVLQDEHGDPYLRTWAVTDISWDDATRAAYQQYVVEGDGFEFRNLETLFGWGLRAGGRVVVANDAERDERAAGIPDGHPPLSAYLAIPVMRGNQLVGQMGVANRPGGYDEHLLAYLQPFTAAVGNMIDAYRNDRLRRQAERAQARSESYFATIVDHLSEIVTVMDADGRWIYSSPAGSRLLGYSRGVEFPGGIFDLLHEDDVDAARSAFVEVLNGSRGPDEPIDLRVRAADGTYRILETVGDNLTADPAVGGVVLMSRDVTERRLAEERLRTRTAELGALAGNLRDGVLFLDDHYRIVFTNQVFCDVFGYQALPEELTGWPAEVIRGHALDVMSEPDLFLSGIEEAYADHLAFVGRRVRLRTGRVLEQDYIPVADDQGRRGHLWIYRDVTERAKLDDERRTVLEQERAVRAGVEAQVTALRELDQLKTEFVATVSHELRTPLTSIVSFAGILAEDATELDEEHREFLDIILRNSERLLALVGDLLLVARLESGALDIEPRAVAFDGLVEQSTAALRREALDKGLEFTLELSPVAEPIVVDPARFEQVVVNLVSNAVKFTPTGGSVTVRTVRDDVAWRLVVADTGIGIPPDEIGRLFQRFFRGSNARLRELPGTGLGLAITRAIVDLHGGALDVESSAGGTTVSVTIPDGSTTDADPSTINVAEKKL